MPQCTANKGRYGDEGRCPMPGSDQWGGRCCKAHTKCRYKTKKGTPCTKAVTQSEHRCPVHKRMEEQERERVDAITARMAGINIEIENHINNNDNQAPRGAR